MKNQKGITLIALVITIIVMLILVAVTINVATEGNLFTHAANAAKGTKTAIEGENAILNDDLRIEAIVAAQTGENSTPAVTIIHLNIGNTTYDAEEGMTWEQWVNSTRYNVDEYYIATNAYHRTLVYEKTGASVVADINVSDPIESGRRYLSDLV